MNNIQPVIYKLKTASEQEIRSHLYSCNDNFSQPLSQRVKIEEYSKKIFDKAMTFEAWHDKMLVGLVAAYFNDLSSSASGFITNVSVRPDFMGEGIATTLMNNCLEYAKEQRIKNISLEVSLGDDAAVRFYKKFGFSETETRESTVLMHR